MSGISLTAPMEPHELDKIEKGMRRRMDELAARVAAQAAVEGRGRDLLLRVYLAGLYHGTKLMG